ncbi:MAG: hypothetical protein AAF901_08795 [Bacteroidota bacterium]
MKITYIFLAFVLLSCTESIISVNSGLVNDASLKKYNIYGYYSLPKTVLKVKIPIAKSKLDSGILKKKDSCVIRLLNQEFGWSYAKQPKDSFALDKKITFEAITLPDTNKRFAIAYQKAKTISQTLNVTLSKDGLIQSGEFAQESKAFEVAKKSVELAGTLIGAASGLGTGKTEEAAFEKELQNTCTPDKRVKRMMSDARILLAARNGLVSRPTNSVNTTDIAKYHIAEVDKQLKAIKEKPLGGQLNIQMIL